MTSNTTSAFTRKNAFRVGAGAASAGVLGAFSLIGAAPAMAATDADCNAANTISIGAGEDAADIQTLLDDATADLVCLDGTFVLDTTLIYYYDVTLHGLPGATLDGDDAVQILTYDTLDDVPTPHLIVENLTFTGGGSIEGGAIYAYTAEIFNSVFDDNQAFIGGAISAYSVEVTDSTFVDNNGGYGGAIASEYWAEIYGSTFSGNVADEDGGAILGYGVVEITNSTFFENSSSEGNGGAVTAPAGTIVQSTFLNNTTDGTDGQAIAFYGDADEEDPSDTDVLELRGNIFAGTTNLYSQVANFGDGGTISDLGGNVFSTSAALENDFTASASTQFTKSPAALFGANTLASNGGLTQTVALIGGSPAIDAVPDGEPSVTVDQRGTARGALSDSGAYEYVPALAATGSTPNGWVAGAAAALLAAGAGALLVTRRKLSRR